MFSRREREYLRIVSDGLSKSRSGRGSSPSPGYRRKLQWSIRQKAGSSLADWELLARAARTEPRLVSLDLPTPGPEDLVYREPVARFVQTVHRILRRSGRADRRSSSPSEED